MHFLYHQWYFTSSLRHIAISFHPQLTITTHRQNLIGYGTATAQPSQGRRRGQEHAFSVSPMVFHIVVTSYCDKFSSAINNNHTSVEPQWLWYSRLLSFLKSFLFLRYINSTNFITQMLFSLLISLRQLALFIIFIITIKTCFLFIFKFFPTNSL